MKRIKTTEDNARATLKSREKQRKKMIKTKYGQAAVKHSKKGIISCRYAAIVCILLLTMLAAAYATKGKMGILVGGAGLVSLVVSGAGLAAGIKGFKERNKSYTSCKVGVVCNGLLLLGFIIIFFRGLF